MDKTAPTDYNIKVSKVNLDLVDDAGFLDVFRKQYALPDEQFMFLTFRESDLERRILRKESYNCIPRYLLATFPNDEQNIKAGLSLLEKLNPHLILIYNRAAYDGEDFMYNRITYQFKFEIRQ